MTTDRVDAIDMLKKAVEDTPVTTDLKSKTVEEAFEEWEWTEETYRWNMVRAAACHGTPDDSYPFQSGWKAAEKEYSRRLEEVQQKIAAQEAKNNYVGRWLSAALNDPAVCEEMKDDIRLWMASDYVTLAAHDAELTAKAKAEALEETAELRSIDERTKYLLRAKAAEYRAKAKGE